ncbi:retrotransposon protein, putative, ty3-gypsy subclass [Tanacetum coccineum]
MTTINQRMSAEEIEQVVAQRVANAIEANAIYETKTDMARKSMSQTERQEDKVAENASNKRKWEGNHNGSSSQQNKGHKVPRAHTTRPIRKKAYARSLPLCNQCKFHHNGPCTISTLVERQAENKRKLDNNSKNNQNQQQPNKRQNIGIAYTAGHGEKKHYGRSNPLCSKCNYHHDGPCAPKCHECNRVGHLARDYRSSTNANTTNNQKGIGASQKATCYECGNQGHYRRDFPKQKNQNHENQIGGAGAGGVVRTLRGGETDQDPNNIEDEIKA